MILVIPSIISAIESPQDRDLMTDFYTAQNARMYAEAWKYLSVSEDVEDIVFEALTKIIDKMEVFRELLPAQRLQYAVTTVRNLSYIHLKRKNTYPSVSFDVLDFEQPAEQTDSIEEVVEKRLFLEQIGAVWREIKMDDRMLLEQKYILKWTDEELAIKLSVKPQSVRMRLTRAKRSVLKELRKKGFDLMDWI